MTNTISFKFGQIVLVRFPFTNQQGSKNRPAVVVSSVAYNRQRPDIILMAVTSQIQEKIKFDEVPIENWQTAGLLKPSIIKPVIFTAEKSIIKKVLGNLEEKEQNNLKKAIGTIIG